MKSLRNKKVVVITGASRGLGKALAEKMAGPNTTLVLCSKDIKELNDVCSKLKKRGMKCYASKVDVSKKSEIIKFIRTTLKKFSRIDIVINNAGAIHKRKPIEKITDEELDLCMKTNFESVFYTLREVMPSMKKRGSGIIITISSTAGKRGNPEFAAYSASKFAVTGLMQSAARAVVLLDIRCLTILPAGINTAMRKYILGTEDAKKQQSPETVSQLIKEIIENEKKFPNGSEIEIRDDKMTLLN